VLDAVGAAEGHPVCVRPADPHRSGTQRQTLPVRLGARS
jgi:hypothetical protein